MLSGEILQPIELFGMRVRILCDDPLLRERLAVCYGRSAAAAGEGDELVARIESEGGRWRCLVPGRDEQLACDPIEALRTFNHELLHAVMRRAPSLYFVHASVVDVDGTGVVFPGLSQAGKSTLALAMVLEGARFLSDELLAFDPASRTARAFPRAFKVRDVCVPYFPELEGRFVGQGEGRFLPFAELRDDVVRRETRVGAVVTPHWSAAKSGAGFTLEPTTSGGALLDLTSSSLNFGTHKAESVDLLGRLVDGVRAWRLRWSEPRSAAAALLAEL